MATMNQIEFIKKALSYIISHQIGLSSDTIGYDGVELNRKIMEYEKALKAEKIYKKRRKKK